MIFAKRYQPEVLDKWHSFIDNFQMSSMEFYDMVKKELGARKVPGLTMDVVTWKEGGVLSDNRQYLRLTRERWVFDICAAPFGTGYLFSYRFTELPIRINLVALFFTLFVLAAIPAGIYHALRSYFDPAAAFSIFFLGGVLLLLVIAINQAARSFDLDSMLLQLPGLGPVYDRFFRKHTYYREDTRLMYLATVPAIVKKLTDQVTAADGVKQPPPQEAKPILRELADAI